MNIKSSAEKTDHATLEAIEPIQSEKALRSIIPNYPKILDKRIQGSLDHFSLEFISVAKIAILACNSKQDIMFPVHVGLELNTLGHSHFTINKTQTIDSKPSVNDTFSASLYFMVPGLGHGLRVNGTLNNLSEEYIFKIEQVYFHCARAAARAEIWSAKKNLIIDENNIIQHSPFLFLKTMNSERKTEISPRGDKAGFVKILLNMTLLIPERPGNKIVVSLRNIIACPNIELMFMVPGCNKTLNIKGTAKVISDQVLLNQCTVNGKIPKTGILIHIKSRHFQSNITLDKCGIWDSKNTLEKPSITSFSKALSAHINGRGLLGKATSAIIGTVIKHDMKNLY